MSRGLRNNNPGNIRINNVTYRGEKTPSADRAFKQFETAAWGYRAMFVLLHTYRKKYGLSTLRQMIHRYAPPVENNTDNYVLSVVRWSEVSSEEPLDTLCARHMKPIVAAMSRMENGVEAVSEDVDAGWDLFTKHQA